MTLRILTLNLNGIRSAADKGFFRWLPSQEADLVAVQELKAQEKDLTTEMRHPDGYSGHFHFAEKKGYSGVGLYLRQPPLELVAGIGEPEFDAEGRYLEAIYPGLSVVSLYLPSGSAGPERQASKFRFMEAFFPKLRELRHCGREVVICGDWNIAHTEKDLKNWRSNQKHSGFLPEERAWLTRVFDELGWVDVYRRLYPEATEEGYTWWSNRGRAWEKNVDWRIDYQIATPGITATARAAWVYKDERFSDHAPLIVDYDFALAQNPR